MPSAGSDLAPFRFSTEALPERERVPFWREVFGRQVVHCDFEPARGHPFEAAAAVHALPGLRCTSFASSASRNRRPASMVADGDDAVVLLTSLRGTLAVSQRGREAALRPGDSTLLLHAEPSVVSHSQIRYRGLIVPRAPLALLVTDFEDAAMRPVPRDNEALRLLVSYLNALRGAPVFERPKLCNLVATHIHDVVAAIIGTSRDGGAITEARGVRAARLALIKADIKRHVNRADLTLHAVAKRQGVTPRSLQRLFESEGSTFSTFVIEQRLALAHRLLTDKRCAAWTIGAVAFAAGFGDLSYFHRVYRRRYGATPSDVRAASMFSVSTGF
jgi:AraC-like DNA-binding protein